MHLSSNFPSYFPLKILMNLETRVQLHFQFSIELVVNLGKLVLQKPQFLLQSCHDSVIGHENHLALIRLNYN
ncbi:hypothetical protein E1A91_A10G113900v1 [Gossypium mustelinum]|uniref:Uncharacterized protein n=1 Tax=Gossypium mustelinum TaxID=34275 RepID=A0A5D2XK69_GOSMU|nr:hypothetical protein E1A91_A10G113900v1 [Gossypium mustelinum]